MIELDAALELENFSLRQAFQAGEGITVLFGRSGAGKTLTLDLIAGLMRPSRGTIRLDGEILTDISRGILVPPHKRRIGTVFQDLALFPHLTVHRNLQFGRWFARQGLRTIGFDPVVETLGLGKLLARYPANLSGGERQRVALGRALLSNPRLLLLDEPLAALDRERKLEILCLIERLRDEFRIPMIYVSHAIEEVARLAGKIVVLEGGHVAAAGSAAEILPLLGHESTSPRFERLSILTMEAGARNSYGLTELRHPAGTVWLAGPAGPEGGKIRIAIKATEVAVSVAPPQGLSMRGSLHGHIASVECGGPLAFLEIELEGGDRIAAAITRHARDELGLANGTRIYALIKAAALDERMIATQSSLL